MKKIGTASSATIVIAWPSITGCWCISAADQHGQAEREREAEDLEQRRAVPARPPQARRKRDARTAGDGGLMSCGCDCHQSPSSPRRVPLWTKPTRVDPRRLPLSIIWTIPPRDGATAAHLAALDRKLTSAWICVGGEALGEVRGHDSRAVAGRQVGVRLGDRGLDALLQRRSADLLGGGVRAVGPKPDVEVRADRPGGGCRRQRVAPAAPRRAGEHGLAGGGAGRRTSSTEPRTSDEVLGADDEPLPLGTALVIRDRPGSRSAGGVPTGGGPLIGCDFSQLCERGRGHAHGRCSASASGRRRTARCTRPGTCRARRASPGAS